MSLTLHTVLQKLFESATISKFKKRILSSLEYLPHSDFQKRIVSAETIRGNTVPRFIGNILGHQIQFRLNKINQI